MKQTSGLFALLVRSLLGTASTRLIALLIGLVNAVLLTRVLGADGYGIYAYAIALLSLILLPVEYGVGTVVVREVATCQAQRAWQRCLLMLRQSVFWVLGYAALLAVVAIALFGEYAHRGEPIGWASALLILSGAWLTLRSAVLRGLHRVVASQTLDLLFRPTAVGVGAALVILLGLQEISATDMLLAYATGGLLAIGVAEFLLRTGGPIGQAESASEAGAPRPQWFRSIGPLAAIGALQVLNAQADLLLLGWFRPVEEVGIYRVALQGANLVLFAASAISIVVAPTLAKLHSLGDGAGLRRIGMLSSTGGFLVGLPVVGLFWIWGDLLLERLFGHAFGGGALPLAILCGAKLIQASVGVAGHFLIINHAEKALLLATGSGAVVTLTANLMLIPSHGMVGAAMATALGTATWTLLLVHRVYRTYRIVSLPFWGLAALRRAS